MLYLCESDLRNMQLDWSSLTACVRDSVSCLAKQEFAQPVKPYLRYREPKNRIIAMPAFIGGATDKAGIKWIASFPDNIHKGLKRAHSVTILNNAETGVPEVIVNGSYISAIRTAAVSGAILQLYAAHSSLEVFDIGMTGFGPIGQTHLDMLMSLLQERVRSVTIFDLKKPDESLLRAEWRDKVRFVDSWEQAYQDKDIFITCTVSSERYINHPGRAHSLHLNVSLRDYETPTVLAMDTHLVDSWEEICRENTDIHRAHLETGLGRDRVLELQDIFGEASLSWKGRVMFSPMGMAIFDIAVAKYFADMAEAQALGTQLQD